MLKVDMAHLDDYSTEVLETVYFKIYVELQERALGSSEGQENFNQRNQPDNQEVN